jgi:alpha-2-macroglobulin
MDSLRFRTWILGVGLLLLSACRGERAPEAPQQVTPDAPDSAVFALETAGGEPYEGRPALRLDFSQPLAAAQPFDELIQVAAPGGGAVSGSWILDGDGRVLRFPYVVADIAYSVSLAETLAAADGRTLGQRVEREVHSGALPPSVGFASQGSVLPARNTDGLPLISINVREVDVEFLRVRDKQIGSFFARFARNGQRGLWELQQVAGLADSVYMNRFALESRPNERTVSHLPVQNIAELREPGLYFATLRRGGDFAYEVDTAMFFVSDLGLHARAQGERLWLHVASLANGQPQSGVQVEILDAGGRVLHSGGTDASGQVGFDYRIRAEHLLVAKRGRDVSYLSFRQPALDLSDFEVAGRPFRAQEAFAWSGRDLYRPGETLQLSALLRDHDGRRLPGEQPLIAWLKQPDGQRVASARLEPSALGYYAWNAPIGSDAPTGRWSVELRLDPGATEAVGRFDFRVEEFLPERLKLALESAADRLAPGQALPLSVQADYLYGAPADGNRFTAELAFRPDTAPVVSLRGYLFGDPTIELPKEPATVLDLPLPGGRLDQDVPLPEEVSGARAPVQVNLIGAVYESGGRAVRRVLRRSLWPAESLIGARPQFDIKEGPPSGGTAAFDLVRSDAGGTLSAAAGVQLRLLRERREYRWTWNEGQGWRADFDRYFDEIETRSVDLSAAAPVPAQFRVDWGDYRLEIVDPTTQLVTRIPFVAGWSWDNANRGLDARPDKVKIALDAERVRIGDKLGVTLTPPAPGPGLLLVESGAGQHYAATVQIRAGARFEIPVTADWARHDVYVTAIVFADRSGDGRIGPQRAVGVAHVPIAQDGRSLKLELSGPELVRPGETLRVALHAPELAGSEAYVALDAVDRGVLNLTGYALPDALAHFIARRALGTEAYDLYGRIIERLAGTRARLRYGGDAELAALPQARRPTARVQTVALHQGPVAFDAEGRAELSFEAPDFNGALRLAALAWSADRYGRAEGESIVRAPLVVEVSSPRVMAPDDEASLSIDLQNLSGAALELSVRAEADAPLRLSGGAQRVALADGQLRTLRFPLGAEGGSAAADFRIVAEGAGIRIERSFQIAVRPAWPDERRGRLAELAPGQRLELGRELFDGLYPGSALAQLSLAANPPLPLAASLAALERYPYACVEQTSAKLWPLVLFDTGTRARLGLEAKDEATRARALQAGFGRIASLQTSNGHFSFWPGEGMADPRITPFVADLLLAAREAGLEPPADTLEAALDRLNQEVLSGGSPFWSFDHAEHLRVAHLAYSGYVLARAGRAPLGSLRALYDHERGKLLTALPLAQLGLALSLQGDAARGDKAIGEALLKAAERPRSLFDFGSTLRDEALMLALLARHEQATGSIGPRVLQLARQTRSRGAFWRSTQEDVALLRLGAALAERGETFSARLQLGDETQDLAGRLQVRQFDAAALAAGGHLANSGDAPLVVALDVVGAPRSAPAPSEQGLRVRRAWFRMDGTAFEGGRLREGEALIAKLTVESEERLHDVLVVDLLPGGLEAENLGLADNAAIGELVLDGSALANRRWSAEVRFEEYRDDRYAAALKLWPGQPAELFYLLRAVSPGRFVVPPPQAEDMYQPELRAIGRSAPSIIEVVEP